MSITPIQGLQYIHHHSNLESPSDCQQCRTSRPLEESSSDNDSSSSSQSISIHVNALQKPISAAAHRFDSLQKEIQELQTQNQVLLAKNHELMSQIKPYRNSQKALKRALKEKQMEILQLKNQLSFNNYGLIATKSGYESNVFPYLQEQRQTKTKSRSQRKHHKKVQSQSQLSISQEFDFCQQKIFKKQWQMQRLKLQQQIGQLQEKVLSYESQLRWSMSLACKIVTLGNKLAFLFKEKINDNKWSLKRQAKASWRYLKHILSHLLQIQ